MITHVKIAPPERWCEGATMIDPVWAGKEIAIIPSQMTVRADESGTYREWQVARESLSMWETMTHCPGANMICEHMIEID